MKILTVVGARPQFIKAATVSRKLKEKGIDEFIVHTGQHHDANMSQVFFDEMDIPVPNVNLGIHNMSHAEMTGRMMVEIEKVLVAQRPHALLVYGDTNSTMSGALAAAKLHIPVAHVEAGLRSFNMRMPEEVNRVVTDRVSRYLFCPTAASIANLKAEGFEQTDAAIVQSGDVMYDSVLYYRNTLGGQASVIDNLPLKSHDFVLATLHRAENTDDPVRLAEICSALNEIHKKNPVVLPLHPRTRTFLKLHGIELSVCLIEPVGYFDMLRLLDRCGLVMTDSGGLQKESYFSGKFCITLRDETEWTELVDRNVNSLAGANREKIVSLFHANMNKTVGSKSDLYGDGNASGKIADYLSKSLR
jgi:UDP-GlcNAc3NAcA epimerase